MCVKIISVKWFDLYKNLLELNFQLINYLKLKNSHFDIFPFK